MNLLALFAGLRLRKAGSSLQILVIDDFIPDSMIGSGTPRAFEFLRALAATGAEVTHVSTRYRPDGARQRVKPVPGIRYLQRRGDRLATIGAYLRKAHARFDIIVVSRRHNLISLIEALGKSPKIRTPATLIYDSEAVFAAREALQRKVLNIPASDGDLTIAAEVELARLAQVVIAVNEVDAALYRAAGYTDVVVLGHAIAPCFDSTTHAQRKDIIFVGPAFDDATPNGDALIWFADRVLPLLRREIRPDLRLVHIGVANAPAVRARGYWALELRGPVPDLREVFRNARLFVAPTRFSSGIPLKVCEAAAYGVPCVITPLLAQQLGWVHEREALVAETAEDFAHQCLRLYRDADLWERIRSAALARVTQDHSRSRFDQTISDLYASLAKRRRDPSLIDQVPATRAEIS